MIARYRPQSQAPLSIIDAMDDSALFGAYFVGPSWDHWRSFLSALFALKMTAKQRAIYRQHTNRQHAPTNQCREAALVIGRRGGKSRILAAVAIYLATFRDYRPYLAPGEVPVIAIIAADRKQARIILRYCLGLLRHVDLLAPLIERDDAEAIELSNGVSIEISTGSIASPRGRTFVAVLADEIAFWRSDEAARNPDTEVLNAVRPGLASLPGSMLLLASSPYARRGALWNSYKRHFGRDDSPVLVWQASTREMNPTIDKAVVEAAYDEDPASAAAEYGAQFRTDVETFITMELVEKCVIPGRIEQPAVPGINYTAFADASSGSGQDSMSLAIGHATKGVGIIDCLREVRPRFNPSEVVESFSELLKSYGIIRLQCDRWGGDWVSERFKEHGITCEPAPKPKSDIYREFLPLLNAGRVELLDLPRLHSQLVGLERRTARGGKDSIDHAPGAHDDLVNSAAGMIVACAGKPSRNEIWAKL